MACAWFPALACLANPSCYRRRFLRDCEGRRRQMAVGGGHVHLATWRPTRAVQSALDAATHMPRPRAIAAAAQSYSARVLAICCGPSEARRAHAPTPSPFEGAITCHLHGMTHVHRPSIACRDSSAPCERPARAGLTTRAGLTVRAGLSALRRIDQRCEGAAARRQRSRDQSLGYANRAGRASCHGMCGGQRASGAFDRLRLSS